MTGRSRCGHGLLRKSMVSIDLRGQRLRDPLRKLAHGRAKGLVLGCKIEVHKSG